MAHEDLLRILGVDGNLTPAAVVTWATERAIETNLLAAAVILEIGTDGDQHDFTVGYESGPSLSARLLKCPLDPPEAAPFPLGE